MHHHAPAAKGGAIVSGNSTLDDQGWEKSEFPILCETCLGPNPYVRMTKAPYDKECKICARPFTVFRWRPGKDARHKMTVVCQTCAKLKNVCQTCLFDLQYGLPVQVRDQELAGGVKVEMPTSDAHKEWFAEQAEKQISLDSLPYGKVAPTETLLKLARTAPYYARNLPRICSFYVKGECSRGTECPYRHEMPTTGELAQQNIKDRYYGVNDPVANKLLRQVSATNRSSDGNMGLPEDKTITTLYVGGLTPAISEEDIRGVMYPFGTIESIRLVPRALCAFVTYATRDQAETACRKLYGKMNIKGTALRLMWGRPQGSGSGDNSTLSSSTNTANANNSYNATPSHLGSIVGQSQTVMYPSSSSNTSSNTTTPSTPAANTTSTSSQQPPQQPANNNNAATSTATPASSGHLPPPGMPPGMFSHVPPPPGMFFPPPLPPHMMPAHMMPFPFPPPQMGMPPSRPMYPSMNPSALGSKPQRM